jgi:hypothetical protein
MTKGLASRPWQLRSDSAESFLMLASAILPNRRYAEIAVPVVIIAGARDQLFDVKAKALRLESDISQGAGRCRARCRAWCIKAGLRRPMIDGACPRW